MDLPGSIDSCILNLLLFYIYLYRSKAWKCLWTEYPKSGGIPQPVFFDEAPLQTVIEGMSRSHCFQLQFSNNSNSSEEFSDGFI